jgi:hypothetical protein
VTDGDSAAGALAGGVLGAGLAVGATLAVSRVTRSRSGSRTVAASVDVSGDGSTDAGDPVPDGGTEAGGGGGPETVKVDRPSDGKTLSMRRGVYDAHSRCLRRGERCGGQSCPVGTDSYVYYG